MAQCLTHLGIETRRQILSSAGQLFAEKGVDKTSLKDIAKAAGISPGTLFYYYSSKADLIFDVTDQHFDRLTHQLVQSVAEAAEDITPAQTFLVTLQTIVNDQERGRLHHYLIEQAVSSDSNIRKRFFQKYQEWRAMIESSLSHFDLNPAERKVFAQILLATLDGLVIQAILGVQETPLEQIADLLGRACSNDTQSSHL